MQGLPLVYKNYYHRASVTVSRKQQDQAPKVEKLQSELAQWLGLAKTPEVQLWDNFLLPCMECQTKRPRRNQLISAARRYFIRPSLYR